ncbi:MAG: 6-phosphogluconolactonase [Thermoplasmata archaeon]
MGDPLGSGELRASATCREAQEATAVYVAEAARRAIRQRGRFLIALSGGRTPEPVFALLGARLRDVAWDRVHIGWVDERAVPPEDPRSNFGSAWRHGISGLPVPPGQIHRIRGEIRPLESARDQYEDELAALLGGPPAGPGSGFDIVLLGVGPDGHTASLFPGSAAVRSVDRWVVAEPEPGLEPRVPRISLSLSALGAARERVFLVCGSDKKEIVHRLFTPHGRGEKEPARRVAEMAPCRWFVDREASPLA